jgi:hypothetical protein
MAHGSVHLAAFGRRVEIEHFGEWIAAENVKDPVWDPTRVPIRA